MAASPTPSHLLLAFSDKEGVRAWRGPPNVTEVAVDGAQAKVMALSDDGRLIALVDAERVRILQGATLAPQCVIEARAVIRVYFSPLASFVVTFQRPPSDTTQPLPETLIVWDAATGAKVHGWALRVPLSWPTLRWTSDELVAAALLHKGSVVFFTGRSFARAVQHLNVPDLRQFSLSPGKDPYHIAVFVPGGQGGVPGSVMVYRYPQLSAPVLRKSFHADSVSIDWNARGTAFLLQVSVEVDRSNQSYYGKTGLHLMRLAPKPGDLRVTDEHVSDAKWHPQGEEFAVIYGAMPDPKISVFGLDGSKRMDLAEHDQPRNTLHYDPTGRVLCVGGFASLKGDMDFWDIASPTLRKLGKANAFTSAYHAWSPDGRYFIACVLSPRIRIDNGVKCFDYYGQLVHELRVPELFEVRWLPWAPAHVAPLLGRPISPRRAVKAPPSASGTAGSSSATPAAKTPSTASSSGGGGVYRHPNWKGSATSISAPRSAAPTPTKYDSHGNAMRTPVGGTVKAAPVGGTPVGGKPVGGTPVGGTPKQAPGKQKKKPQPQPQQPQQEVSPANKKRNLEKKLRQIEVLRLRQEKGESLNAEQLAKIASMDKVQAEIAALAKELGEGTDA